MTDAKLLKLRPTQMTVGFEEVEEKRREWRDVPKQHRERFLVHRAFPAVRGPDKSLYITDHHHLGLALIREEVKLCYVTEMEDLSGLEVAEFWVTMDHRQWTHLYDAKGKRRPIDDLPKTLTKLEDDPFRSLAAEVRRKGGFAKETAPFAEFLWADFFRRRIPRRDAEQDTSSVIDRALALCHEPEARHLPGWSGPA